jgi:hypothetical protein
MNKIIGIALLILSFSSVVFAADGGNACVLTATDLSGVTDKIQLRLTDVSKNTNTIYANYQISVPPEIGCLKPLSASFELDDGKMNELRQGGVGASASVVARLERSNLVVEISASSSVIQGLYDYWRTSGSLRPYVNPIASLKFLGMYRSEYELLRSPGLFMQFSAKPSCRPHLSAKMLCDGFSGIEFSKLPDCLSDVTVAKKLISLIRTADVFLNENSQVEIKSVHKNLCFFKGLESPFEYAALAQFLKFRPSRGQSLQVEELATFSIRAEIL